MQYCAACRNFSILPKYYKRKSDNMKRMAYICVTPGCKAVRSRDLEPSNDTPNHHTDEQGWEVSKSQRIQ